MCSGDLRRHLLVTPGLRLAKVASDPVRTGAQSSLADEDVIDPGC